MTNSKNKIALVTGGSRGLGKNSALQLAQKGFDVIITYQSQKEEAAKTVTEIQSLGRKAALLPLDLANISSFEAFATNLKSTLTSDFGVERIDALVNNAGSGYYASINETTEAGFDAMSDIHLKAPFFLTQKLVSLLNDGGSIVNTSSGLSRFSYNGYAAYAIMKAAIDGLTRYQAVEFGSRKIRSNSVAPGAIETDFGGGRLRDDKDLNQMISNLTPLGRVGKPDDIGSVVAFLCSDESKWVNGQRIEASGGIHV
jgi:NAD(P)-dependent dehydrogenase (short-subunit alcohol dehydrogenase family)